MQTLMSILLLIFLLGFIILLARILLFIVAQITGAVIIKLENRKKKRELDESVTDTTLTKLLEDEKDE